MLARARSRAQKQAPPRPDPVIFWAAAQAAAGKHIKRHCAEKFVRIFLWTKIDSADGRGCVCTKLQVTSLICEVCS